MSDPETQKLDRAAFSVVDLSMSDDERTYWLLLYPTSSRWWLADAAACELDRRALGVSRAGMPFGFPSIGMFFKKNTCMTAAALPNQLTLVARRCGCVLYRNLIWAEQQS